MRKMTVAQAKQIDLVDYLASLGYYPDPKKSRNGEYWYLSPLPDPDENHASFKVDRRQATETHYIQKNPKNKKAPKPLSLKNFRAFKAVALSVQFSNYFLEDLKSIASISDCNSVV